MTINHIIRLDEALIWLSRIDKKVELGLVNKKITADFFYLVFMSVKRDITLLKDT